MGPKCGAARYWSQGTKNRCRRLGSSATMPALNNFMVMCAIDGPVRHGINIVLPVK
jgi:hypothetical protein